MVGNNNIIVRKKMRMELIFLTEKKSFYIARVRKVYKPSPPPLKKTLKRL